MDGEIFSVRARRCKRCGRLLTSTKAVQEGYGESCRCKVDREEQERKPIPGQMTLFDCEEGLKNYDKNNR